MQLLPLGSLPGERDWEEPTLTETLPLLKVQIHLMEGGITAPFPI